MSMCELLLECFTSTSPLSLASSTSMVFHLLWSMNAAKVRYSAVLQLNADCHQAHLLVYHNLIYIIIHQYVAIPIEAKIMF